MATFTLFSDNSSSIILYDFLEVSPTEDVPPIQFKIFISNEEVIDSAEKGLWAAYLILKNTEIRSRTAGDKKSFRTSQNLVKLIPPGKKYYVVIDFEDRKLKRSLSGESSGLAFSLEFAREIYKKATGKTLEYSFAATGELDKRTREAGVKKVEAIEEKFKAALKNLKAGDKLFYPLKNEQDINPILKATILNKGIILCPVSTVEGAIELLFENYSIIPKKAGRADHLMRKLMFGILAVSLIFALIFIFNLFTHPVSSGYDQIIYSLEHGKFIKTKNEIKTFLNKTQDGNLIRDLEGLKQQLDSDLFFAINFEYYEKENEIIANKNQAPILELQDLSLSNNDGYRFKVTANKNCYFYLFQFDSEKSVELLFPLSSFSMENHFLISERSYSIPGANNYFFIQDEIHQGLITIYFIASFWRAKDIEQAFYEYEAAKPGKKKLYQDKLLERMFIRSKLYEKGIKGIFFKKEFFLKE